MGDRRTELVRCGAALALRQRFQDAIAGVDTRSITDAAGVTTGSFFHHFRNRAHFAEVVADRFIELWDDDLEELRTFVESVIGDPGPDRLRATSSADWARLARPGELSGLQHLLWVTRNEPLSAESSLTAGEVLASRYRARVDVLRPANERAVAALGREMLPPFTAYDLTVVLSALADGLSMAAGVEPDGVREDLYADVIAALMIAFTRPRAKGTEASSVELATLESQLVAARAVRSRSEDRRMDPERCRQIAEAAATLFVDRRPAEVTAAEVAAAAGVSERTVLQHFGSVTGVAAASFVRHGPELEEISTAPLTEEEGPVQRIEQVLSRYVELVKENPGVAEAVVAAVLSGAGSGAEGTCVRDLPDHLPLPRLLVPHIRELRTRGLLRRRVDTARLAWSITQLATMQALTSPDDPVERIVDDVLGLALDGALVGSDHA